MLLNICFFCVCVVFLQMTSIGLAILSYSEIGQLHAYEGLCPYQTVINQTLQENRTVCRHQMYKFIQNIITVSANVKKAGFNSSVFSFCLFQLWGCSCRPSGFSPCSLQPTAMTPSLLGGTAGIQKFLLYFPAPCQKIKQNIQSNSSLNDALLCWDTFVYKSFFEVLRSYCIV